MSWCRSPRQRSRHKAFKLEVASFATLIASVARLATGTWLEILSPAEVIPIPPIYHTVQDVLYLGSYVTKEASPVPANVKISGHVSWEQGREHVQSFWRVAEDGRAPCHLAHPDVAYEPSNMTDCAP